MGRPPDPDEQEPGTSVARTEPGALQGMQQPGVQMTRGELAAAAMSAQARAAVESRDLMALLRPRSIAKVRESLLLACKRPVFATKARYAVPRGGKKITGFSIRFAEEVARCLGNVLCETAVIHDDAELRIVRCTVTDLETNNTWPLDVPVKKTVERKTVQQGDEIVGTRTNAQGEKLYIKVTTDDEINVKQAALVSKALRTGILRVCPADILEECEEMAKRTVAEEDAKDPLAAGKQIADAWFGLGIGGEKLEKLLGKPMAQSTAAERNLLRQLWAAYKEGETTWPEIEQAFGPSVTGSAESTEPKTRGTSAVRELLAKRTNGAKKDETPAEEKPRVEQVHNPTPPQGTPVARAAMRDELGDDLDDDGKDF